MKRIAFTRGVMLGIVLAGTAEAQQAGVYDLSWSTVDQGGARASGGVYTLDGTVGQADATLPASAGVYTMSGGYWPGVQTAAAGTALFKDGFE